jgi:transposase-like protein
MRKAAELGCVPPSCTRPIQSSASTARSSAAEVVGIFPNHEAIVRLVGALLLEQNDKWAVQRARYMILETMASMSDGP